MTKAWPRRRTRLAVRSRFRSRQNAPIVGRKPVCFRRPERAAQHAQGLLVEVFRQVGDPRLDGLVHRMHGPLGRVPKRPDIEREPSLFEGQDFLGDEGLGKAWIAFHDDGDASGCR